MSNLPIPTSFVNIMVSVRPGAAPGKYIVQTEPPVPVITEPDTIINYQLVDTGGYNIVFKGMSVKPVANNQLSAASLSVSAKLLTFSDANTEDIIMNITLKFQDQDGVEFMHDPQIKNEPRPT